MKKFMIYGLLLIFAFTACKKKPLDYRNKYMGDWRFDVKKSSYNVVGPGMYEESDEVYDGSIAFGASDSTIVIRYTETNEISVSINVEGKLGAFPTHYCSGEFTDKENLTLFLRWGGLGGGVSHSVTGKKKK